MKKLSKTITFAVLTSLSPLLFSSCATIVSGGDPSIVIYGNFTDSVTITTERETYSKVTLPAIVKVDRHHLEGQRIQIASDKYTFNDIILQKTTNAWAFGNILLGGIIGLGVDLATNCVSIPKETQFRIYPMEEQKKEALKKEDGESENNE